MLPFEDPSTPLQLLMACHERIDRYLGGLAALADASDLSTSEAVITARDVARYLRLGLPLHGEDEDLSLAPRLRAALDDAALEQALDQLVFEHAAMMEGMPRLLALLDAVVARQEVDRSALRERQGWLDALLRGHVAFEEAEVFPVIDVLGRAEQEAIVREIRARRGGAGVNEA